MGHALGMAHRKAATTDGSERKFGAMASSFSRDPQRSIFLWFSDEALALSA
jgi:hypothetical protein